MAAANGPFLACSGLNTELVYIVLPNFPKLSSYTKAFSLLIAILLVLVARTEVLLLAHSITNDQLRQIFNVEFSDLFWPSKLVLNQNYPMKNSSWPKRLKIFLRSVFLVSPA